MRPPSWYRPGRQVGCDILAWRFTAEGRVEALCFGMLPEGGWMLLVAGEGPDAPPTAAAHPAGAAAEPPHLPFPFRRQGRGYWRIAATGAPLLQQDSERCWNLLLGDAPAALDLLRRDGWDATPGWPGICARIGRIPARRPRLPAAEG